MYTAFDDIFDLYREKSKARLDKIKKGINLMVSAILRMQKLSLE